jgi:hypothetical protein
MGQPARPTIVLPISRLPLQISISRQYTHRASLQSCRHKRPEPEVVGDSSMICRAGLHQPPNGSRAFAVQIARGLVSQKNRGRIYDSGGDRNPPLLASEESAAFAFPLSPAMDYIPCIAYPGEYIVFGRGFHSRNPKRSATPSPGKLVRPLPRRRVNA